MKYAVPSVYEYDNDSSILPKQTPVTPNKT